MRLLSLFLASLAVAAAALAQSAPTGRDLESRERYEQVLARSPYQDNAFEQVYNSYLLHEGLDAWRRSLAEAEAESPVASRVVRARIAARRLEHEQAAQLLEEAREAGAGGVPFALLLGRLYHDTGRDEEAAALLEAAYSEAATEEERVRVSRLLGNLLLRMGQREAAIAAWERIAEGKAADVFVLEELAMLYEGQRMEPEAIGAWERIVELAEGDPYLRCRALRAIGGLERARGEHEAAAAAYREALGWVAPGNWLFDALSRSLLEVSAAMDGLPALITWLEETLRRDPAHTEYRLLLGDAFARQQDWEAAEAAYREAIERAPARQAGYDALIRLREVRGETAGIVEAYREAIERFPEERDYHHRLGLALLRAGEQEAALEAWRAALGPEPEAEDHAALAQWLETRGFREEAIEAYADAIALTPRRSWSMRLASLEYESGRRAEARARWLALAGDEASPDALVEVAGSLEGRGYREDAETLLARALERAPERMDIVLARADMLLAMARFDDAETAYGHLREHATSDYHRERGERGILDVLEGQGRLAAVRSEWEQTVRDEPDNVAMRVRLAQLCARMGDRGRAVALYQEAVALEPENPALLQRLARAHESAGNPGDAIAALRRLIEIDPGRAGGYYRELVPLLVQHGTEAEAIQAAERLVAGSPADPEARVLLARVHERFNQMAPRLEAHREAARLAPDEPTYHEALGRALAEAGEWVEARDAYRLMLDTARDASLRLRAVQQLASVHQRLERMDELVEELEARVQRAPRDLEGYELLAAAHRSAGAAPEALAVLERAAAVADDREAALRRVLLEAHAAGRLETVVRTYEELARLSATMEPREWEQLGQSYAKLGRFEEAEQAWDRMLTDHANDEAVLRAFVRVMREHGLHERAFAATEQLLTLQPHDYRTRLEHAEQLAGAGRVADAIEQLRTLLRVGDAPAAEGAAEDDERRRGTASAPFQASRHFDSRIVLSGHGAQRPGNMASADLLAALGVGMAPGGGAYNAVARQALHLLAQYAMREGVEDDLVAEYEDRVAEQPDNLEAHHELLLVLVTLNRNQAVLAHADAMARRFEDEPEVLRLAGRLLEVHSRFDDALDMYERLHAVEETSDSARMGTRIRLLTGAGRIAEARAEVDAMLEVYPEHVGILRQAAGQMAAMDDLARAEELYRAAGELDPHQRQTVLQEMAHHYRNRGHAEDAARLYAELIFTQAPPAHAQRPQASSPPALYLPHARQSVSNSVDAMIRVLMPAFNWPRMEAFQQTVLLSPEAGHFEDIIGRMTDTVLAPAPEDAETQRVVYEVALLLTAHAIERGDTETAFGWIPHLERLGAPEQTMINARLMALEASNDLEGLRTAYQDLVEAGWEETDLLHLAIARLALVEERWAEAEETLAEVLLEPGRQREVVGMIRQFHEAGEHARAKRLLEGYLKDPNPLPEAYALRVQLYTAMGEHEAAMRYAQESWEQYIQPHLSARTARLGQVRNAQDLRGSPALQLMLATFKAADRTDQLIAYLEEWRDKQPNSPHIQVDLAGAYRATDRHQKAYDIYAAMLERRPSDHQLQVVFAQLLAGDGRDAEAYALFDEALRADPVLYHANAWHARQLYDRLGKSAEIAEIERRMALSSTEENELRQMAQMAANSNNHALAAILYERLSRLVPGEFRYRHEMAEAQRRAGDLEGALESWRAYLAVLSGRPEQTPAETAEAAVLFARMGLRGEIETLVRERLDADPLDGLGRVLAAGMAYHDGEFHAAFEHIEQVLDARGEDHAAFGMLIDLARVAGDYGRAITLINERSPTPVHYRWSDLAELYAAKGGLEQARQYWERDAARMSGHSGVEQTIRRMVDHGMYDQALDFFDRHAVQMRGAGPRYNNFLHQALRAYLSGGTADEEWARALLRLIPDTQGWVVGALAHDHMGLPERRMQMLSWALEERPEDEAVVNAVLQVRQHGRSDDAIRALLEALIASHPDHPEVEAAYTNVLTQRGEKRAALAFAEEALARGTTPERLQRAFGICRELEEPRRMLALRDAHWDALDAHEQRQLGMRWAYTFAEAGDQAFALEYIREEAADPTEQEGMDRHLDLLYHLKDGRAAFAAFEEALADGYFEREGHLPGPAIHALAGTGRLDDLLALAWGHGQEGTRFQATVTLQRVAAGLRAAGATPWFMREWANQLERGETPAIDVWLHGIEAAERLNFQAWRHELLGAALTPHPAHWELLQRKADTLRELGRLEESAALLDTARSHGPISRHGQLRNAQLDALVALGDQAGIDRILTESLTLMPMQAHAFGRNAQILARAGQDAEAVEAWTYHARNPSNRDQALEEHAAALARLGRVDELMALLEEEPALQQAPAVLLAMLRHGRQEEVSRLLETMEVPRRGAGSAYPRLIDALLATMEVEVCARALNELLRLQFEHAVSHDFTGTTVNAMLRHRTLDEVLELLDTIDQAPLWEAAARSLPLIAVERGAGPEAEAWLAAIGQRLGTRPGAMLNAVERLMHHDVPAFARALLEHLEVLEGMETSETLQLARFAMRAEAPVAAALYAHAFAQDPARLLDAPEGAAVLQQDELPADWDGWLTAAQSAAYYPEQWTVVEAGLALGRGDIDAATTILDGIESLHRVRGPALEGLALWMARHGHEAPLVSLSMRVAGGGVLRESRMAILAEAFRAAARQGNIEAALQLLEARTWLGTQPAWALMEKGAAHWPSERRAAAADHLASLRTDLGTGPAAMSLAYLEWLLGTGEDGSIAALAEGWGLAPWQRDMLHLAVRAPKAWWVSPRHPVEMPGMMDAAPDETLQAALSNGTALEDLEGWTLRPRLPDDPEGLPGAFTPHWTPRIEQHGVYLATDLHSPDECRVTFASSADDWHRVWVNGEEVFQDPYGGPVIPGEDRYEVELSAGANRVVVWLGNEQGTAAVSLGIVQNGAGVQFHAGEEVDGQYAKR